MDSQKILKSKQILLEKSKTLFRKYGVSRITVEEICRVAGVSKMTFYRNFNNKNELAEAVLRELIASSTNEYRSIMDKKIPFAEKIEQLILLKHRSSGDISEEFIRDIYQKGDSGLKQIIDEFSSKFMEQVMTDFSNAQQNGWIRKDIKLEFILYYLNHLNSLMTDENLLRMYNNSQDVIMELTKMFFYGITESKS